MGNASMATVLALASHQTLGRIGLAIVVRVLGLILCAMAVQFILSGIADSTHGLILDAASKPYQS